MHLAPTKQLHTQVDIPTASFIASCPINNSHPAEKKHLEGGGGGGAGAVPDRSTDGFPQWSPK